MKADVLVQFVEKAVRVTTTLDAPLFGILMPGQTVGIWYVRGWGGSMAEVHVDTITSISRLTLETE